MRLSVENIRQARSRALAAFTFTEMMVATGVFALVVAGTLASHIMGIKMFHVAAATLNATRQARGALGRVRDEIRASQALYVGSGGNNSFTGAATGSARQGNAVKIIAGGTSNTNSFVCYYVDVAGGRLMRQVTARAPEVVAKCITNTIAFSVEDIVGNVLTNDQANRIIHVRLDCYQSEFPVSGTNAGYNHYRVETRVSQRTRQAVSSS
jgi:hypothetical protein